MVTPGTGTVLASLDRVNLPRNTQWLRSAMPARRIVGRIRVPRIAGGSGASSDALRQSVRERLADRRLPLAGSVSVARRGTGRACDVCGAPITRDSVEHEVEHAEESHGFAHEECYRIWRDESRRADAPDLTR